MANKPLMPILKPLADTKSAGATGTWTETKIKKIISYGSGWLTVELSDGSRQKRYNGTLSWRNNNPGNIKFGDFAKAEGAIGPGGGGHAVFPDLKTGRSAMKKLLFTSIRGYNTKTIRQAIATYAPASDGNKPDKYAKYVASQLQVSLDTKLNGLSETLKEKMLTAMMAYEGFKNGDLKKV